MFQMTTHNMYFIEKYTNGDLKPLKLIDHISRVERKTGVSQMVVFPQT